jgi:ligand-binding sensor domain-containing protein
MKNSLRFFLLAPIALMPVRLSAQFTVYNSGGSGLNNNYCWFVNVNSANEVWVSTMGGGLNRYNGSGWVSYTKSNSGIGSNSITPVIFDGAGNTWAGSYDGTGGLSKFNGTSWTVFNTSNSGISNDDIIALAFDPSGDLWIGTRFNGVCRLSGNVWTVFNQSNSPLPSNVIYSLETDPAGNIWIGTALGGLAKLSGSTWTLYNSWNSQLPGDDIYSLKFNPSSGSLWVGTATGLGVLNIAAGTWQVYNTNNSGIPSNYIRGISFHGNSAWLATGTGGIARLSNGSWTIYNSTNSNLPSNQIWSVKVTGSGILWAATYGGGVVSMNANPSVPLNVKVIPVTEDSHTLLLNDAESAVLRIRDAMGRSISEQVVLKGTNNFETMAPAPGIYYYTVQSGDRVASGRFVLSGQ